MEYITKDHIRSLYFGSLFTACGGGEYSEHLPLYVERHIETHGPISLMSMEELPENGQYLTVGIMGSMLEANLQNGKEGKAVVSRFCQDRKLSFDALFTIEASSLNILFPILVAGIMQVPIIDGDCMGRAFPEFQMTTAQALGENIAPISLLTPGGEYYYFEDLENLLFEVKAREIVSHEAGIAYFTGFPLSTKKLKTILLKGTLSFVKAIGSCFISTDSYTNLFQQIINATKNSIYGCVVELFLGIVQDIGSSFEGGRSWTNIVLQGTGAYRNSQFSLLAQNECLIAYRDNHIAAMVPDLITLIDLQTLKPLSLSALHKDMKVAILGIPAPVRLKSKDMLKVLGPDCFGYSKEYIPLEKIYNSWYYS